MYFQSWSEIKIDFLFPSMYFFPNPVPLSPTADISEVFFLHDLPDTVLLMKKDF